MGNMFSRFIPSKDKRQCVDLNMSEEGSSDVVSAARTREITNSELILEDTSSSVSDAMICPDQCVNINEPIDVDVEDGSVYVQDIDQVIQPAEDRSTQRYHTPSQNDEPTSSAQAAAMAYKQGIALKKRVNETRKRNFNQLEQLRVKQRKEFARAADINRMQTICQAQQSSNAREIDQTVKKIFENPKKLVKTKVKVPTKNRGLKNNQNEFKPRKPVTRADYKRQQLSQEPSIPQPVNINIDEDRDRSTKKEQNQRKRSMKTKNFEISIKNTKSKRTKSNKRSYYDSPTSSKRVARRSSSTSLTKLLAKLDEEKISKKEAAAAVVASVASGGDNQMAIGSLQFSTSTSTSISFTELLKTFDKGTAATSGRNVARDELAMLLKNDSYASRTIKNVKGDGDYPMTDFNVKQQGQRMSRDTLSNNYESDNDL